tara:strand:+ start:48 stop:722 length:675 start_codon:yes stop_codon:yes gene_type:complete
MILDLLFSSPILAAIWLGAIIAALTVHEFSHALAGYLKGDRTAYLSGRLTLNPLAHLDPFGFMMMVLVGFGWAKPVPYNPYNLKNPRVDGLLIALAGPFSNLIGAAVAGVLIRIISVFDLLPPGNALTLFLFVFAILNLFLMFFNLIPVDPLDGSKVLDVLMAKPKHHALREQIRRYGPMVLMFLVILSIAGVLDVFSVLTIPSFITCDVLTGSSCVGALSTIF